MKKLLFIFLLFSVFSSQVVSANLYSDSDLLFDWAENQYPELFSPSNQSSEKLDIWYFRSMRTGPVHQGPLQAELGSG